MIKLFTRTLSKRHREHSSMSLHVSQDGTVGARRPGERYLRDSECARTNYEANGRTLLGWTRPPAILKIGFGGGFAGVNYHD